MKKETISTFSGGLNYDLNPITTPNNVLTDCVNGSVITFNGDELALQNDAGNTKILVPNTSEYAKLSSGFYPLGAKEYGGVLYIVSGKAPTATLWSSISTYITNSFVYDTFGTYYKSLTSNNNYYLPTTSDNNWEVIGSWNDFVNKYGEIEFGSYPSPANSGIAMWKGKELDYRQDTNGGGKDLRLILYKPKIINDEYFRSGRWIRFKYRDKSELSYVTYRDPETGIYNYKVYRAKLYQSIKNTYFDVTQDIEDKFHAAYSTYVTPTATLGESIITGTLLKGIDNYGEGGATKIKLITDNIGAFADKGFIRLSFGQNTLDIDYNGVDIANKTLTVENTITSNYTFDTTTVVTSPWIPYWFMNPYFNYYCPNLYIGQLAISLEFEEKMTFELKDGERPILSTDLTTAYNVINITSAAAFPIPAAGSSYSLFVDGMESELQYIDKIGTTGNQTIVLQKPYRPTKQFSSGTKVSFSQKSLFYLYDWNSITPGEDNYYIFITSGPRNSDNSPADPNLPETWSELDPTTAAIPFSASGGTVLMGATPVDENESFPEFFTYTSLIKYTEQDDSGENSVDGIPLFGKSFGSEYWNKWCFILTDPFVPQYVHYPSCYNETSYEGASMSSVLTGQLNGNFGPNYKLNYKLHYNTSSLIIPDKVYTSIYKDSQFQLDTTKDLFGNTTGLDYNEDIEITIPYSAIKDGTVEYKITPGLKIGSFSYNSDDSDPESSAYLAYFPEKFRNKFEIRGKSSLDIYEYYVVIFKDFNRYSCSYSTGTERYYQISVQNIYGEFLNENLELTNQKCVFIQNGYTDKQEAGTRLIGTYNINSSGYPTNVVAASGITLLNSLVSILMRSSVTKLSQSCKMIKVSAYTSLPLLLNDTISITQGGDTISCSRQDALGLFVFYVVPNMLFTIDITKPGYNMPTINLTVDDNNPIKTINIAMIADIEIIRTNASGGGYAWSFKFTTPKLLDSISKLLFKTTGSTTPTDNGQSIELSYGSSSYLANLAANTVSGTIGISPQINNTLTGYAKQLTYYEREEAKIDFVNIPYSSEYVYYNGAIIKDTISYV